MKGLMKLARPISWTLTVCAFFISGCAGWRIDPSGERLLAPAPPGQPVFDPLAGPHGLVLGPQTVISPIGSQVVMVASVRGPDDYLRTNQRVEWALEPGSVGQLLDVNHKTFMDWVVLDANMPAVLSPCRAVGSTARQAGQIARGAGLPGSINIVPGQAWLVVGSTQEGTSYLSAASPCAEGGQCRKATATIHWVDVQWTLPQPSINPSGTKHTLTTTVMRQSNRTPLAGYRIRYEIADGPPAGFGPQGDRTAEVVTNDAGQASAEIVQKEPNPGTNRIGVQIIRPAGFAGTSPELVVGSGLTLKTWTSPGVAIRKTGPAVGSIGATLTYRIVVSNPGDQPAENVVVTDTIPPGLSFLTSRPAGEAVGNTIRWTLGRLGAAETRTLEVDYRADREGTVSSCSEASATGGLTSKDCVTTAIGATAPSPTLPSGPSSTIGLEVTGPTQASVGDQVLFRMTITNRGASPAVGLVIRDEFDPGLEQAETKTRSIEKDLPELAPGESREIRVKFRVAGAGQLCNTVEIRSGKQVLARQRACVTVAGASPPGPLPPSGPTSPPGPLPPPGGPGSPIGVPGLSLKLSAPPSAAVGETARFRIEVTNTTANPLNDVKVSVLPDPTLDAAKATDGYQWDDATMYWLIATLPPNDPRVFEVEARCVAPAADACLRVQLASRQGLKADDRKCVQIRAAAAPTASNLSLGVTDRYDPITVGKEETYDIEVVNSGQTPDTQVTLLVQVPQQMVPVQLQTVGPALDGGRVGYEIVGQNIRFQPVGQLDPGQKLNYRVRTRTVSPGEVELRAQVSSQNVRQPQMATQKTTILSATAAP